jgi:hypothetical protein
VEAYLQVESFEHPEYLYYREPPEAWDKLASCNRDCWTCSWCNENIEVRLHSPWGDAPTATQCPDGDGETDTPQARPGLTAPTAGEGSGGDTHREHSALCVRPTEGVKGTVFDLFPLSPGLGCFRRTRRFGLSYRGASLSRGEARFAESLVALVARLEAESAELSLEDIAASNELTVLCQAAQRDWQLAL